VPGLASLDALVLWFLPPELQRAEADTLRRAKLCAVYNLTVPLWGPGFAVLLWALGQPIIGTIIGVGTICSVGPLFVLRRTGSLALTGNLMSALGALLIVSCAWLEGGLGSPGILWFPLVPILAVLIMGRGAGVVWTAVMVATLVGFYVLDRLGLRAQFVIGADALVVLHLALATSAVVVFMTMASFFESLKADALRSLETANRALAQARDQAETATRVKSDFLATMSHEIRTPLHGIFGMTELAIDATDDAERRDFIQRARGCAETLLTVINDILDFSRIEAEKLTLERREFDLRAVLDGMLDTLAAQAGQKGLELIGCLDEALPSRVLGDAGRLRQILVKFPERGEVVIHLGPAAEDSTDPGTLVLCGTVRDTGIGIPRDRQAAIFEAFTQGDTSTTSRYGGTGLGLAITQRLVALMGGEVSLESALGQGSTFRFTARLGVAAPPPAGESGLARLRVLVVDDHPATRHHLMHTLRAWGAAPTPAAGAAVPLGRTPFDVVLLDLTMPQAEWPEVMRRLRAQPAAALAPIVALVGGSGAGRTRQLDFAAVVSKPVKSAALLAALRTAAARTQPAERAVGWGAASS
jgi:signal transduction histidine kinase